ncbi:peptidylprolyl isomerase [Elusimicrobiota bacterium]
MQVQYNIKEYLMKYFLTLICVSFVVFSGCSSKGKLVAKIGGDKITQGMLEDRMSEAPPMYLAFLSTDAGKKQFLDLLVRERIVLEAARKDGFLKTKDYKKALADFRKDQAKRLRDYRENLLMEMYVRHLHENKIGTTETEVENYYKENKKDFDRPVEIVAKHILLETIEDARIALKRVKAGEDFSKVAKEMSKDAVSAVRGGEIGPFRKGDLVPEFEKAVFRLKLNTISDVVKTQFGYHVIKKIKEKALPKVSQDNAKETIGNIIEKVKFDAWLEETKRKYKVSVNYEELQNINIKSPEMPQSPIPDEQIPES